MTRKYFAIRHNSIKTPLFRTLFLALCLFSQAALASVIVQDEIANTKTLLEALSENQAQENQTFLKIKVKDTQKYLETLVHLHNQWMRSDSSPVSSRSTSSMGSSSVSSSPIPTEEIDPSADASSSGVEVEIFSPKEHRLEKDFHQWIIGATHTLDYLTRSEIPVQEILELRNYVETHRSDWAKGGAPKPYWIKDQTGKQYKIEFELDHEGTIYIEFENSLISKSGVSKEVYSVVRYNDWARLARVGMKVGRDEDHQKRLDREFKREKKFLRTISSLPKSKQVGLVETAQIGRRIYQLRYDSEFFDLLAGVTRFNLLKGPMDYVSTPENQVSMALQLAHGLYQLHQLGICHADIKPENILVKFPDSEKGSIIVAIADFGLSYKPLKLIAKGEPMPSRGSPHYAAPEVILGPQWVGADDAAKAQTAMKSDVYSLATIIYMIFHGNDAQYKYPNWFEFDDQKYGIPAFLGARAGYEKTLLKELSKHSNSRLQYAVDKLLIRAFQQDPTQRMSSEDLLLGLQEIETKFKIGLMGGTFEGTVTPPSSPNFGPMTAPVSHELDQEDSVEFFDIAL